MKKVREKLNAKLRKSGGFTLIEMLIVVAIIAILIAVSIPLIGTTLEKAREGVDEANERSAMSLAEAYYLTNFEEGVTGVLELYYSIDSSTHQGKIVDTEPAEDHFNYGLSTAGSGSNGATGSPKGNGIKVTIDQASGDIKSVAWE